MGEFIIICRFGVPREIHSDQGTNVEYKVMPDMCKLLDIEKTRTTPLHPQLECSIVPFYLAVIEMLRGELKERQDDWDLQLPTCMMAYRSFVPDSTGETPNMLMLRREFEVPLDVTTASTPDVEPPSTKYSLALQQRLASAHQAARRPLAKAAERQKRNYDKRVSNKLFRVGDSVWLHNISTEERQESQVLIAPGKVLT